MREGTVRWLEAIDFVFETAPGGIAFNFGRRIPILGSFNLRLLVFSAVAFSSVLHCWDVCSSRPAELLHALPYFFLYSASPVVDTTGEKEKEGKRKAFIGRFFSSVNAEDFCHLLIRSNFYYYYYH